MKLFVIGTYVVVAVTLSLRAHGPQQQTTTRANWPCGARLDPAYFQGAEGTGGQLLLLAPSEMVGSFDLLRAFEANPETLFRLGGTINPGVHEFHVPIDASVESAMFSISVQCLQTAEVLRPSGAPAAGDGVTDLSNFLAIRMVVVKKPEPGVWTVRVSGSGVAGVIVKARSEIQLAEVAFAPVGTSAFKNVPAAGIENVVRLRVLGRLDRVESALVDAASRTIARLPLESSGTDGEYRSRFTPGVDSFRVMITGTAGDGTGVQRVQASLLTAR